MLKFNEAIRAKIVKAINDVNTHSREVITHTAIIEDCRKKRVEAFKELSTHCPNRMGSDGSEQGSLGKITLTRYFCQHSHYKKYVDKETGQQVIIRCQLYQCPLVEGGVT